jgi:hypothetical protein
MRIYSNNTKIIILIISITFIISLRFSLPFVMWILHDTIIYNLDRANCYKQGKEIRVSGWRNHYCVTVYSDGHKPCQNSQECQGNCIVIQDRGIPSSEYIKYSDSSSYCEDDDGNLGSKTKIEECKMINNEYLCPNRFTIE